jgi:hypothetical protein
MVRCIRRNVAPLNRGSLARRCVIGRALAAVALFSGLAPLVSVAAAELTFVGPVAAGTLEAPPRQETSGLAVSRRSADLLWTHDDSGGAPMLYAIDTKGKKRGALRVLGVKNDDWEDVASFEREGKAWLIIGDVGDNDAKRETVRIHVVEEPEPKRLNPETVIDVSPAYTLRVRYEDGPRDCEAVAVDAKEGAIYLLTKRDAPPRLYRVPLGASAEKVVVAKFVGLIPNVVGQTQVDSVLKHLVGKRVAWPTAMDFAADGRAAVVLTYGEPLVFAREPDESWLDAFKRAPGRLMFHGQPQAEAICFSADGRAIFLASEAATVLVRYDREER